MARNQRLGVLCALLESDCWEKARDMLRCMPEYYAFATCDRVTDAFAAWMERNVDPYCDTVVERDSIFDNRLKLVELARDEAVCRC